MKAVTYAKSQRVARRRNDGLLSLQIEIPELAEECHLVDLDPEQENRRRRQHAGPAYDEDDDHPGMNRVQCATS